MLLKRITDSAGVEWEVWEIFRDGVRPTTLESETERDAHKGWLCFHSTFGARKRLLDYPADWSDLPEDRLLELFEAATASSMSTPTMP